MEIGRPHTVETDTGGFGDVRFALEDDLAVVGEAGQVALFENDHVVLVEAEVVVPAQKLERRLLRVVARHDVPGAFISSHFISLERKRHHLAFKNSVKKTKDAPRDGATFAGAVALAGQLLQFHQALAL